MDECRCSVIEQLLARPLDVLVVGGGIVGAGIARDAAMRGLRVGLVEQHDLAFGASSRSSRLLHGGIRYLAQGRVGMVREASREKGILHSIAPHLAEPLAFVFPTYRRSPWPLWKLAPGVKLYDALCGGKNLGASQWFGRRELLDHLPGITSKNLTGGVRYFDALTNDARLVLDTLRSAARHGAMISNYTRLEEASPDSDGWRCELRDVRAEHGFSLTAQSVVNAAGPWAEKLAHSRVRLRLTKGVHLVIDRARLPVPEAVVVTQDRRILFAIPWGRRVILGTTDTDYDGPPEQVCTEPDDIQYILEILNRAFPSAGLSASDVRSTWAGLRPLLASRRGGPSDISRAHRIDMPEPGWLDVAGGKLTTYRLIAQQAVDRLLAHLNRKAPACRTAEELLLPAEDIAGISGILPPPVDHKLVEHFCRNEWAEHLDDVMLRRTSWHYYLDNANEVAIQVAAWMAPILGWDGPREQSELARYQTT